MLGPPGQGPFFYGSHVRKEGREPFPMGVLCAEHPSPKEPDYRLQALRLCAVGNLASGLIWLCVCAVREGLSGVDIPESQEAKFPCWTYRHPCLPPLPALPISKFFGSEGALVSEQSFWSRLCLPIHVWAGSLAQDLWAHGSLAAGLTFPTQTPPGGATCSLHFPERPQSGAQASCRAEAARDCAWGPV